MRRAQQFPPTYPVPLQILLDDFLTSPFGLHHSMRQVLELLRRQSAMNRGMPGAHDANEAVPEQPLLENVRTVDIGK